MPAGNSHFPPGALTFLRGLEKHNDRTWFNARKSTYESALKEPMLALIADLNHALEGFAPEHVRPPHKAMMRIYRDTRFSREKIPYKTHTAAWWARAGLEKTSGAGFYLQVSAKEVLIAAGCYMPEKNQLLAIRRYLLDHHEEMRRLLSDKKLTRLSQPFEGLKLTRAPKGFPAQHPAMDLILCRQWGVSVTLPPETALGPDLVTLIATRFRVMAPLVEFLNTPLTSSARETGTISFGL